MMARTGACPSRIRDGGGGLTPAERGQVVALSHLRSETARRLGCAEETLDELLSAYGRVRKSTLERIRARLAEVSSLPTTTLAATGGES